MGARRRRGKRRSKSRTPLLLALSVFAVAALCVYLARTAHKAEPQAARLSMDEARALNAATPFATGPRSVAKPFRFKGTPAAREQAIQCLATAAIYEAGDDPNGQKAVMQVILNRAMQSRYPRTICGIVYEGSGRQTGCQFSFTCDGSEVRRPERKGWERARTAARQALSGRVFRAVGRATHYHTDWSVPYWRSSLDKIAQIHSHIFYGKKTAR